jgi:muramoyltetrapeptide carboxypeptidase
VARARAISKSARRIRPARLRPGDWVAVVAPAGPVPHERLEMGVRRLEQLDLRVRLGASVLQRTGYLAGDDGRRAADLLGLWAREDVRGVFCARGGYGTARIADLLTPAFLRRHPKVFCGFSDITTLHGACARAGLVSFHGPMVAWDLASGPDRADGYDADALRAVLFEGRAPYRFAPTKTTTIAGGRASGRLAGGCLSLLVASIGTPEQLDARGTILLLEDEQEPPYRIDRMLTQLLRTRLLRGVRGIVLGDFPGCEPDTGAGYALFDVVAERLGGLGVPVLYGFPFGHTRRPNLTLPLGVRATLDATRRTLTLEEAGVR